ncbi:MAG: D-alanine--D-alanine ligase [Bacteroidales bacterium]
MNIAVFTGGNSSEHIISVRSAEQVIGWLSQSGHHCHPVVVTGSHWMVKDGSTEYPFDKSDFSVALPGGRVRFDCAWIVLHGTPGEDGKLQGYLDMMGIPYNSSGLLSSAMTFDKYVCKSFLKQHQVLTPEAVLIRKGTPADLEQVGERIGFPCFVKPNNGGSSFGITRVSQTDELEAAIQAALKEDGEVVVERFIKGTEVTCGIMKTRRGERIFPLTEIVSRNEFFDFEAKYTPGMAEEITPARIEDSLTQQCQKLASVIYDLTKSSGLVRIDFIIKGNQVYFLELNSLPGMSAESIVPKQVQAMGLTMPEVLQELVEDITFAS